MHVCIQCGAEFVSGRGPKPKYCPPHNAEINRLRCVLQTARHRAKVQGVPFGLSLEDLPPIPEACPILRVPMEPIDGRHGGRKYAPTLDKIFPERGYVPGNVRWISHRANRIKSDASPEELMLIALDFRQIAQRRFV